MAIVAIRERQLVGRVPWGVSGVGSEWVVRDWDVILGECFTKSSRGYVW
jgi:hypothetical protein